MTAPGETWPAPAYAVGDRMEYTSFAPSGWTPATVAGYPPAAEQWLICPGCGEQAVPGPGSPFGLRRCPRCETDVRFPASPPLVDVRTATGSLVRVRESQLRDPAPGGPPRGLASCGHPANEDGECDCSWWPERAPAAALAAPEEPDEDPPDPGDYDPGPEVDDVGGASEHPWLTAPEEPF